METSSDSRSRGLNLERMEFRMHDFEGYNGDVADSLPVDPFGMDMKSTVTAIKGWIQDFDGEFGTSFGNFGIGENDKNVADDGLYMDLDLFFDGSVMLPQGKGDLDAGRLSMSDHTSNGLKKNLSDFVPSEEGKGLETEGGDPHDALFFALGYLGVEDLLTVEGVCKSLRDAVRGDSLLWRNIRITQPLSLKVSDAALAKLTSRAQGTLECLSIFEGIHITDHGLKHVLQCNPNLTTLYVPGCVQLSADGILSNLKALKSAGTLRIKHLRIGGVPSVTETHFKELKSLLGVDSSTQPKAKNPQFHCVRMLYHSGDIDDRAIDVETCPKCEKVKLVFDCPRDLCQMKDQSNYVCRGCTCCISRCIHCGCCIRDLDYEETFCLDYLCLNCFKYLLGCQDKSSDTASSSASHSSYEVTRYQIYVYHEEINEEQIGVE